MSKSNSSTRSNSVESPGGEGEGDVGSPQGNGAASIAEGGEGEKTEVPSSPPPTYERVLEEEYGDQRKHRPEESALTPQRRPEILHKSSKELYKAVAKQFGITCKMSDQCRCLDCQSHYFDCEYDQNEQQKTDGGLGAGTPMFISEVIHGTACRIL